MRFTIILASFLLLLTTSAIAQGSFSITTSNEVYQNLENSNVLNDLPWEDEIFEVNIPFEFQFLYQSYDKITIKDGKVSFDNYNWISPFGGVDLEDKGNITASFSSQSPISTAVTDELGLQILKIEFKNVGFYNGSFSDVANFQVWLYSNNAIEFRYGNNKVSSPSSTFEMFSGPIIGVYNESSDGLEGCQILGNNKFVRKNILGNSEDSSVSAFQDIPKEGMVIHFEPEECDISAFAKDEKSKDDLIKSLPIQPLEETIEDVQVNKPLHVE